MRLAGDANPAALQARARHVRTAARNDAPPPSSTARTTRPSASGPGWDALRRKQYSATGTRTRVARVRAEYPNQLDYSGLVDVNLSSHGRDQKRVKVRLHCSGSLLMEKYIFVVEKF